MAAVNGSAIHGSFCIYNVQIFGEILPLSYIEALRILTGRPFTDDSSHIRCYSRLMCFADINIACVYVSIATYILNYLVVKFTLKQATTSQKWGGDIALLFL